MHDKIVRGTATVVLLLVILFVVFPLVFSFLAGWFIKVLIVTAVLGLAGWAYLILA